MEVSAYQVAKNWEVWCGDTPWSRAMREWAALGGRVLDFGGRPRCASAIPLCFVLIDAAGCEMPGQSRLKDIRAAVAARKEQHQ